jgi:type I site-specific restriction-modification system R (restriction) subunit
MKANPFRHVHHQRHEPNQRFTHSPPPPQRLTEPVTMAHPTRNSGSPTNGTTALAERNMHSSPSLRNKKDLIEAFVDSLSASAEVDVAWQDFVAAKRTEELERIIAEENLKPTETRAFVRSSFRDGALQPTGTAITKILPPVSRFAKDGGHATKKATVLEKLTRFFDRFQGLGG